MLLGFRKKIGFIYVMTTQLSSEQEIQFKKNFFIKRIKMLRKDAENTENSEETGRIKRIIGGYKQYLKEMVPDFNFDSI